MEEIGLFPLGIVLLPGEHAPLHIFEPRYRELIGECLEDDREFGLLFAEEEGIREVGTLARVTHVLEQFEDGRLNILVSGGARFRVEQLTQGRTFMTALVEPLEDESEAAQPDAVTRALEAFRALATVAGVEVEDLDESSPDLAYDLAGRVELPSESKQRLLESVSEQERLELVAELFDDARRSLLAVHELGERAKRNGSRL